MFVPKHEVEVKIKQAPRLRSYPATIFLRFDNADREAQQDPTHIEVNVEQKGGIVGFFLYRKLFDADQVEQASALVRELQQLDVATDALPKEE